MSHQCKIKIKKNTTEVWWFEILLSYPVTGFEPLTNIYLTIFILEFEWSSSTPMIQI